MRGDEAVYFRVEGNRRAVVEQEKRQERAPFEECDRCHRRGFCSAGSNVRVIMHLRLEV